jgi:hypothetical protein
VAEVLHIFQMIKYVNFFINFVIAEIILLLVFAVIEPFNLWFYFAVQVFVTVLIYVSFKSRGVSAEPEIPIPEIQEELTVEELIPEVDHKQIWEDIENEAFDLFDNIPPIPVHTKRETFGYINRLCENVTKFRRANPEPFHPNEKEILNQIRLLAEVMVVMKRGYNANPKLIEQRVHYIVRLIA